MRWKGPERFSLPLLFLAKLGTRRVGSVLKLSMPGLLWTFLPGDGVLVMDETDSQEGTHGLGETVNEVLPVIM